MYDALFAPLLSGFYTRVAEEVAEACPSGKVLEVGSGPGRLAVRLVQPAPGLSVTGVDLSPAMVERAARRAMEAGLAGRARFEVGDAGTLSFAEGSFDGAVSTLSMHHWPDPARGLIEIHRVLKPGGEALIYDLAHWLWLPAHGESRLERLVAESPFGSGAVEAVRWPGPVPAFVRLRLRERRRREHPSWALKQAELVNHVRSCLQLPFGVSVLTSHYEYGERTFSEHIFENVADRMPGSSAYLVRHNFIPMLVV